MKVEVGPDATTFVIFKELLVHHSTFFESATKPCWADPENPMTISMLDDRVDFFEVFERWLYSGNLDLDAPKTEEDENFSIDLHASADRIDCRGFCNSIMDYIIKVWGEKKTLPFSSTIRHLCENSSTGSKFLSYFADLFAFESGAHFTRSLDRFPEGFVHSVFQNYFLFSRQVSSVKDRHSCYDEICNFYQHVESDDVYPSKEKPDFDEATAVPPE